MVGVTGAGIPVEPPLAKARVAPLAVAAVLFSIVTLGYQLRLQRSCFDGPAPLGAGEVVPGTPVLMAAPMLTLSAFCIGLGLLALPGLAQPLGIASAVAALAKGVLAL